MTKSNFTIQNKRRKQMDALTILLLLIALAALSMPSAAKGA